LDYGKILRRAFHITLRYKALWLFGFVLALLDSGGNFGQSFQYSFGGGPSMPGALPSPEIAAGVIIAIIALGLLLGLLVVVLNLVCHAALIGMVNEIEEEKKTSIRGGFKIGLARTITLFLIRLVIGIPAFAVALFLILLGLSPLLLLFVDNTAAKVIGVGLAVGLLLVVLGVIILGALVLSVAWEFIDRFCVIERRGVFDSIKGGFGYIRRNLARVGLAWLLMFAVGIGWGLVMLLLVLLLILLVAGPALVTYLATNALGPTLLVAVPLGLIAVLVLAFVGGLMVVFRSGFWTLTYLGLKSLSLPSAPAVTAP
jgi:hypothetical protein